MRCPHCGSKNISVQLLKKDKKDRNKNILLVTIFLILVVSFISGNASMLAALICLIVSMPLLMIFAIILRFIPTGTITYIICMDCGKKSKSK